ncbi:hypothetical protein K469DRAFT_686026 [Zopfia rhizophila CBS 207.26]|uniref:Uncharacterized protein n=1 Tax=Zopfia rhizophila CBS 207.26 TaxID=1314779 RepID=A0A6A6DAK1_9PEZI|nr:hypothetical protein K469DRAFT_686026 [Zopfia rhizophila CBS 207.26]
MSPETIAPGCPGRQTGKEQYSDDQKIAILPQAVQDMSSIPNSSLCYNSDDAPPHSPGLQPIRVKATPSPSPPPSISKGAECLKPRKRRRERKTRPSQGDEVLMNFMDPSSPDIAKAAGQSPLNSASGSETSEPEDEKLYEVAQRGIDSRTRNTKKKKICPGEITKSEKEGLVSEFEEAFGPAKAA